MAGRRPRSVRETLGSIVFGFELIVVFLGALVAFGLKAVPAPVALIGGGILCLAMILTIPLLRYKWGLIVGSVVQAVIVATGVIVPLMFVVGGLFAAMWVYCLYAGGKIDRRNAGAVESGE